MTDILSSKKTNMLTKVASILIVCIAAFIGFYAFKASVAVVAIFIAFLVFYVMLPGVFVYRCLRIKTEHFSSFLSRSFFVGFALIVLQYYLSQLISSDILLLIIGPALSVLFVVSLVKGKSSGQVYSLSGIIKDCPASFFAFFALVFLYSIFTTQYTYIAPDSSAYSYIKNDFAYHAGIINALTANYPPLDPWVDGLKINYHFFTEMLMSVPVKLFGLPSERILLSCTPYMIAPVISVSTYAFFREFSRKKDRAGLYCIAFHLSNMFILKEFPRSWFMYHIYSNCNNAGMGIACLLTALPLLKAWNSTEDAITAEDSDSTKKTCLLAVLIMLMTGIKGPVAIVLVGGIIGTLLLGLILRRASLKAAIGVVISTISFALIYVFVLGAEHSNTSGGSVLNPGEVTDIFFLKEEIMDAFGGMPHAVSWAVLFAALCVIFFMAFLIPFVFGYIRELYLVLTRRREFVFSDVSIYACALVGFLGMILLDFSGHSQVYFGFACAMLVPVIAFRYLEDMEDTDTKGARIMIYVFTACLCVSICTFILYSFDQIENAYKYASKPDKEKHTYQNVTPAEYEGLIWLKDNTGEDALIASDRWFAVDPTEYTATNRSHNTHFAYAVYSKRRQYIEGSGFSLDIDDLEKRIDMIDTNKQLFDPKNEERGELARSLGVSYVVVSRRFNDTGNLSNEDYELCFSNEDMEIYKVK